MTGFYRKHIEKLSALAAPLTDFTRKNVPFVWDETCQRAFETIKNKLVSAPVLVRADLSRPFVVETDASQHHVAGVLLQYDKKGPRTIAYFSKR